MDLTDTKIVCTDTKIVCRELRDIGNSVGFKCINVDNIVFCVKNEIFLIYPRSTRSMVSSNMWFMSISDIVLAVENGVILCLKSRFCNHAEVSWCLSDPNSFDCISSWFKEQVAKYQQYNNSFNNIS